MTRPRPVSISRRVIPAAVLAAVGGGVLGRIDTSSSQAATAAAASRPVPTAAAPTAPPSAPPAPPSAPPATRPVPAPGPTTTNPIGVVSGCGEPVGGPTIGTRWGPVQVAASFAADGSLCDVQVLQFPDGHRKSVRINERALPILHDRAIAAQGTGFDTVSGATVTTRGYQRSLQSILDAR